MKKKCILVVDRDEKFIRSVRKRLHSKGYSVFKAGSTGEARSRFNIHHPDVVLVDHGTTHVEGKNLCSEFKQASKDFVPTIMLVNRKGMEADSQYLKRGADECFCKSESMQKLDNRVYALLRIRDQYSHLLEMMAYGEEISSNIPVSILIIAPNKRIKFANNHFCRKMYLNASEIVDSSLDRVLTVPLYDSLKLGESIREIRATAQPSRGYKISYGGDYYFYKLIPIRSAASETPDIMLMLQDITEVEELSMELRKSEERYRNLFRNSVEPIAMVGMDGGFVMVNEKMCSSFGYSRKMLLSRNIYQLIFDEDDRLFEDAFQKAVAGRQTEATVRMVSRKKELLHVEMSGKKITGRDENLVQIIMRDVTRRLQLEEQLRQSEKMSALGQFTAGVTHEINNPLSIISSYTQYMLGTFKGRKCKQLKPGQIREMISTLKIINKETLRCGKIVNDLLKFSRKAKVEPESVNVNEILSKTLTMLGRQLKLSDITVSRKMSKRLLRVKWNYNLLHQVFMNIILNARESMPEGGRLMVKTGRIGKRVEVEIRDSGMGIPREEISKIFDPFYTTRDVGRGTGLGLSVVHSIVKDHGGSLSVKSKPGHGTSFFIRLPTGKRR